MDWREAACYAYLNEPPGTDAVGNPTGMTHERWAWEFLRRNADYQQEWEQLLASGAADEIIAQEGITRDHPYPYIYSQLSLARIIHESQTRPWDSLQNVL
jgi:hypothetical protein